MSPNRRPKGIADLTANKNPDARTVIVSITMVRNEIDIVEAFVRYHLPIVDKMVIVDNGSSDGTPDVLARLVAEGAPLELLFDDNPSYVQAEIMTALMRHAANDLMADLVVPLDADEFLATISGTPVRALLEDCARLALPTEIEWVTYVPVATDDQLEVNPLKRIRHRRAVQHNQDAKVLVPASLARIDGLSLSQGSHRLLLDGGRAVPPPARSGDICLAHFPVRSASQTRSKYLVGWLANLARPDQVLFDWYPSYNRAKAEEFSPADLEELATHYDVANKSQKIELVCEPLDCSHVESFILSDTREPTASPLRNVLNYTEKLAAKYADLLYQRSSLPFLPDEFYRDQTILQIIRDYALIDGWLSPAEAVALYRIAQSVPRDALICELGSWLGRSSYVLATALSAKPGSRLFCVDPFDASGDKTSEAIYRETAERLRSSILDQFIENMTTFGVLDKITIVKAKSYEAIVDFAGEVDMLFIDGDHDYESVRRDFLDWSPRVRPGGWIAFHDVGSRHARGPKRVVEQFIVGDPAWSDQRLIEELYVARRRPVGP